MALVYTNQKSKKQNKKPGWQQAEAEYAAWLAKVNGTTLFTPGSKPKMQKSAKKIEVVVTGPVIDKSRLTKGKSLGEMVPKGGTIPYEDPRITYKDNPEMLARELKARERKFATAPAYNKGAPQYISEDMMKDITAGTTRRR